MKDLLRKSLLFQVLSQLLRCRMYHMPSGKIPFIRGFKMYNEIPDQQCEVVMGGGGKKHIIRMLRDVIRLSHYWGAFPDTYFRFGMFVKNFDRKTMYSFIPQDAYSRLTNDKDARYHILIDDKILFHDLMEHYGFPVPQRYFVFRNNEFRCGNNLLTDIQVDKIISNISDERIFVKRFTGGAASGVSIFTRGEDNLYHTSDGEIVSASLIKNKFLNQDYIFEKQLMQDEILKQFNPDTVNTIRVLTYNNKVISAAVRFGGKGSFVDNTAKGGVAVSLDINTGLLGDYGMREYDLTKYSVHPDTHLAFKGTKVLQWNDARILVEKVCQYLPYYTSVGFDVATTTNGPCIIEINTGAGVYLSQMGKDTGLASYFSES